MKVGFLLNHDQIHQVAHSLPIAISLASSRPDIDVVVATTSNALTEEVRRLCRVADAPLPGVELRLRRGISRMLARYLDRFLPVTKLAMYGDNLEFFRTLDALVVAEKTSAILKSHYGLSDLKLIHTRHGAGDRAIGFNKASGRFDHVLVSGEKIRDRLVRDVGVSPSSISVVGYPKFDLAPAGPECPLFADRARPVVLYNPHVSPHLSSWYEQGRAVLEYFLASDRYNLIFAPHVMLFRRPFVLTIDRLRLDRPGLVEQRFHDAPNIHVDLGSRASTDMSYTEAADIYLGDVSSQVYEFLRRPRPCVFLDAHGVDHADDPSYLHWRTGEVISDVGDLGAALDRATERHRHYRPIQEKLFAATFDLREESSSSRAARAVLGVLLGGAVAPSGRALPSTSPPADRVLAGA